MKVNSIYKVKYKKWHVGRFDLIEGDTVEIVNIKDDNISISSNFWHGSIVVSKHYLLNNCDQIT